MIKIEIEEKSFSLPSNWNEINLDCLMKLNKVQKMKFGSELEQSAAIIESLSDLTSDIVLDLPLEDFKTLSDLFEWCGTLPEVGDDISKNITIDDVVYSVIDLQSISTGEFISLEVFQNQGNVEDNLHLIAAILIRPEIDGKVEKLKDMFDIQQRANLFKEKLMVGIYWPIVQAFFYGAASSSLTNMPDSLDQPKSQSKLKIANS